MNDHERFMAWVEERKQWANDEVTTHEDGSVSFSIWKGPIENFHKVSLQNGEWVWEMCQIIGGHRKFIVRQ